MNVYQLLAHHSVLTISRATQKTSRHLPDTLQTPQIMADLRQLAEKEPADKNKFKLIGIKLLSHHKISVTQTSRTLSDTFQTLFRHFEVAGTEGTS